MNVRGYVPEKYKCPNCESTFMIWRPPNNRRGKNHLKSLYCQKCPIDEKINFIKQEYV